MRRFITIAALLSMPALAEDVPAPEVTPAPETVVISKQLAVAIQQFLAQSAVESARMCAVKRDEWFCSAKPIGDALSGAFK